MLFVLFRCYLYCSVLICVLRLLFVCKYVLYYCHRVATQMQLTNTAYHDTKTSSFLKANQNSEVTLTAASISAFTLLKKKSSPNLTPSKCYKSNSPSCLSLTLSKNRFVLFQNVETNIHSSHTISFSVKKLRNPVPDLRLLATKQMGCSLVWYITLRSVLILCRRFGENNLDCLILEDGTDKVSRKTGKELPIYVALTSQKSADLELKN